MSKTQEELDQMRRSMGLSRAEWNAEMDTRRAESEEIRRNDRTVLGIGSVVGLAVCIAAPVAIPVLAPLMALGWITMPKPRAR